MDFYRSDFIENTGIADAFFTGSDLQCRRHNIDDFKTILSKAGIPFENAFVTKQQHTDNICIIRKDYTGFLKKYSGGTGDETDGIVSDVPDILLCTYEADCVPVFMLDPVRRAVGIIHSGRKGTAKNIAGKAVKIMNSEFGCLPENIMIEFGPCICEKCYEVGAETIADFECNFTKSEIESFFKPLCSDKFLLDLKKAISMSLVKCNVQLKNIHDCGICTFENSEFRSYRRDGSKEKRMITAIMLKKG